MQLFFIIGMVCTYAQVYLLDKIMDVSTYWRILFAMPMFFIALQIYNFVYKYPYETPKYLISKGRTEEARILLRQFIKPQYVEERLRQLRRYCRLLKAMNCDHSAPD
jgi:hypothetical protein